MLKAGLSKLSILDEEFSKLDENKHPKMLVMCEDTSVSPLVNDFLVKDMGLSNEEIMTIDSNRKGEIKEKDWNAIKQRLFNIDKYKDPKVIISVLMLREGFDVNNICVIVPLRSSDSQILLEQTIGPGLRLMWREPEFEDIKAESRKKVLNKKQEPSNYLDLLSIIEHPRFSEFYNQFIEDGTIAEVNDETTSRKVLGDMITVGLKEDYENYDLYWPKIIQDREETLKKDDLSIDSLKPFNIPLEELNKIKGESGQFFESQELTVKTRFGRYKISEEIFNAQSYDDLLVKIVNKVTSPLQTVSGSYKEFPLMQINNAEIMDLIDRYIKTKLFNCEFDPFKEDNWKILLMSQESVIGHIIKEISKVLYQMQNNVDVNDAIVRKYYFSNINSLRMRENYSINVSKSIYKKLPFPSNKGGFEKTFIEAVDTDSEVDSFIKINEFYHTFATITYIREDGLLARYYPDFIVKISNDVYIVETKADKDISSYNVQSKRIATIDEINKINQLKGTERMDSKWNYVLLGETTFKSLYNKGFSIKEILDYSIITEAKAKGTLDDYLINQN